MSSRTVVKRISKDAKFSTLSQLRSQIKQEPLQEPLKQSIEKSLEVPSETLNEEPSNTIKHPPLSKVQKAFLDRLIRVDQAGELGADYIYAGQYLVLSHREPQLKSILKHMWEQEVHHHDTFNKLQVERRVRPSLLTPLWKLGAFTLGVGTGLIGKEAAMACTVAVETVIGGHYNDQLRVLKNKFGAGDIDPKTGEPIKDGVVVSDEIANLTKIVKTFRDDELEHLDTAIENDAEKAVPYWLLTEAIKVTCKAAIWNAERV